MNRSSGSDNAPAPASPREIRNVVLVGPAGAGKSTLFEHLVAARVEGRRPRDDDRQSSTGLVAASFASGEVVVNLLDTPGSPDFVGDVRAGLRAADAALFVISGADGLDDATRMLWRECGATGMPRAIAVTRLEQARADFDETVATCRRVFGEAQPVAVPVQPGGPGTTVTGLVDLLTSGEDTEGRSALVEAIIEESEDETLLERYLEGEEVDVATLRADLHTAVATARFFPVLPTNATNGVGLEELLALIEQGLPSPEDVTLPRIWRTNGGDFGAVTCDPAGPLVAEVVRTTTDQFVGRQSLVRVFSGTLRPDDPVHVSGHLQQFATGQLAGHDDHDQDLDRVGGLTAPLGDESRPKAHGIAGELVLVSRLAGAETTDTLSSPKQPALVEPWVLPEPLLPVAIHARSKGDEDKLASVLQTLVSEDVTMRLDLNAETHQVVLWTMGPAHLALLTKALEEHHHVAVEAEPLRTALRETFISPCEVQGRLVKQSGGHGQYAVCRLRIEPLPRGGGFEFVNKVVGGSVPKQFIASVEKGAQAQLEKGVLNGYPAVDVRVTLLDGKAHAVDSSDMAFQTAAGQALREAANESTVSMLEPIDTVDIEVGDESVGSALADLRGRRGQVHGTEPAAHEGRTLIHAEIPALELSRYPIDLRSVSHGTGTFTRTFARYDYLPPQLAKDVLHGGGG
ncbi:translation elongation factor EF-G [Janibacter sp. HTCC2649]|uniref:elongation factor G-like protein EF-G2 n=1 Tax=Janibacter sp. HTCC2649 TaxID=313589 RepID=UPI00006719E7|nr:elongation factor G-like protein EF-G2 [Janibacter sp. HTCC2649]EAP98319.1 translation elongation factor EF-G [Janibacter sp. HTCC2649]